MACPRRRYSCALARMAARAHDAARQFSVAVRAAVPTLLSCARPAAAHERSAKARATTRSLPRMTARKLANARRHTHPAAPRASACPLRKLQKSQAPRPLACTARTPSPSRGGCPRPPRGAPPRASTPWRRIGRRCCACRRGRMCRWTRWTFRIAPPPRRDNRVPLPGGGLARMATSSAAVRRAPRSLAEQAAPCNNDERMMQKDDDACAATKQRNA
jgi:hypothetical protein